MSSDTVFGYDQWNREQKQAGNPCDKESPGSLLAAILCGNTGEAPNVSGSYGDTQHT
jgi:hypothetical protein